MSAEFTPEVVNLCKNLKKGSVEIGKLPAALQKDEVLGSAFSAGLITVGRQMYSETIDGEIHEAKYTHADLKKPENEGKQIKVGDPVRDDMGRQVMVKRYKVTPDNEWSWLNSKQENRKPLG